MEQSKEDANHVKDPPPVENDLTPVADLEIKASQIVERLEEAVDKATESVQILEESDNTHPSYKEANLGMKGQSWKLNEGFLQPAEKPIPQILSTLEDLIVYEQPEDDEESPSVSSLPPLSVISKLSFVLQTVSAFCNNLERSHLNNLHNRIHNDTNRWIAHLFRCYDTTAFYHDEPLEGVVRVFRMMLHYRYPKYLEDGYDALRTNPPVIYSSMASSLGIVQHICRQLGLAMSCVRPVPCSSHTSSQHQRMDVVSLERMVEEDKSQNKIPILVLADAGTLITGHVDNLLTIHELCKKNKMWLHVKGHCLASLAMSYSPNSPKRIADSLTLSIGTWLGTTGLPTVTLYHKIEPAVPGREGKTVGTARETTLPLIAGLVGDHFHRRLVSLPLWFTLQAMGRDGIQRRIRESLESSEVLWRKLSKYKCLRLLGQKPGGDTGTLSIAELINKPLSSVCLMLEVVTTTIVFQFVPVSESEQVVDILTTQYDGKVPPYFDKLNSWLGQILQRDLPQLNVEMCELENVGVVLRICPLENIVPLTEQDIEMFINYLDQQIEILSATVRLKVLFQQLVSDNPSLKFVEMDGWAGLGGVRYVPTLPDSVDREQVEDDINRLNIDLVSRLRSTDTAFSLGEGKDGQVCVRFGMVTSDTDIDELLSLVTSTGREIEESAKYLDVMVEIVKKGIETATLDLQKENEERVRQEGIIRHVPVFGSIVNWWYPKPKETGVKGRSLNLQAGVVESTENIYRYHMQMQQGPSPVGTKQTPQPMVQTSIVCDSLSNHSRSSSQSSTKSELHKQQQQQQQNVDTKVNHNTTAQQQNC